MNAYALAGVPPTRALQDRDTLQSTKQHSVIRPRKNAIHFNRDGSRLTDEQFLELLADLLRKSGYLSDRLINSSSTLPTSEFYRRKFGGLRAAYKRIGYCPTVSEVLRGAYGRTDLLAKRGPKAAYLPKDEAYLDLWTCETGIEDTMITCIQ